MKNEKKNDTPIPFEEALKVCSKGSQQKVIWECPRCKSQGVRIFKSAIKIKLCKACNCQDRVAAFDNWGEKNPWFGKVPPCVTSGSAHPSFKGGKPNCEICSEPLADHRSTTCRKCMQKGERNHRYKPELTAEHRANRREFDPEYKVWAREIKRRDNFTCQKCLVRGGILHAHHLNSWKRFPEERYELSNGVTLCKTCHQDFHSHYGVITTRDQYEESCKFKKTG